MFFDIEKPRETKRKSRNLNSPDWSPDSYRGSDFSLGDLEGKREYVPIIIGMKKPKRFALNQA
jgi:hypothetical protein